MVLLTPTTAARMVGLSRRTILRLCQSGRLGVRVGRDWIIREEELAAAVAARPRRGKYPRTKKHVVDNLPGG
jgi:excisionase family DNA binding protein